MISRAPQGKMNDGDETRLSSWMYYNKVIYSRSIVRRRMKEIRTDNLAWIMQEFRAYLKESVCSRRSYNRTTL